MRWKQSSPFDGPQTARALRIIDQRRLPAEFVELDLKSLDEIRRRHKNSRRARRPGHRRCRRDRSRRLAPPVRKGKPVLFQRAPSSSRRDSRRHASHGRESLVGPRADERPRRSACGRDAPELARASCAPKRRRSSTKTARCARRSAAMDCHSCRLERACSRTAMPAHSPPPASAPHSLRSISRTTPAGRQRLRQRNAAPAARLAPHRVGAGPRRNPRHDSHGRDGGESHARG